MDDIAKLRELIHLQAIIEPSGKNAYGQTIHELKENKVPGSVICIAGIPENSLVFNLDDFFPEPSQIFAGTRFECCRADYVIVSSDKDGENLVFLEMKSHDEKDYAHIRNQLKGAHSFIGYCQAILRVFWDYNWNIKRYTPHFVSCTRTSEHYSAKPNRNDKANTSADSMLKLEGSNTYQFNMLIGKKRR